jgi:hypothetical protein
MNNEIVISAGLIFIGLVALLLIPIIIGRVRSIKGFKASGPGGFRVEVEEAQMEGGEKK